MIQTFGVRARVLWALLFFGCVMVGGVALGSGDALAQSASDERAEADAVARESFCEDPAFEGMRRSGGGEVEYAYRCAGAAGGLEPGVGSDLLGFVYFCPVGAGASEQQYDLADGDGGTGRVYCGFNAFGDVEAVADKAGDIGANVGSAVGLSGQPDAPEDAPEAAAEMASVEESVERASIVEPVKESPNDAASGEESMEMASADDSEKMASADDSEEMASVDDSEDDSVDEPVAEPVVEPVAEPVAVEVTPAVEKELAATGGPGYGGFLGALGAVVFAAGLGVRRWVARF